MNDYQERLKDISEIRSMMEESTRFLSLSGLSGIGAGIMALIGAFGTYSYLQSQGIYGSLMAHYYEVTTKQLFTLVGIALGILAAAITVAVFFSARLARRRQLPLWNRAASRLTLNLVIPLGAGAAFCFLLAWYGYVGMVAPATLIFYGMALLNAGKYTLREIRYLGISEIVLGLISGCFLGYGIFFWAIGFGLLHILYGILMFRRYER